MFNTSKLNHRKNRTLWVNISVTFRLIRFHVFQFDIQCYPLLYYIF